MVFINVNNPSLARETKAIRFTEGVEFVPAVIVIACEFICWW